MVRPVINSYQQLNNYQPRIAVIEDNHPQGGKDVQKLIKKAGGKAMIIPRFLSERLLASQGLSDKDIKRIQKAQSFDEVREFDQQIATATRLHLQYITRKLTFVDAVVLPGSYYDIPPSAYHDVSTHQRTRVAPPIDARFQTELMMTEYALHSRKIPILGISAGMQLLVVKTGGKLIQHLPEYDNFEQQVMQAATINGISKNAAAAVLERVNAKNRELISQFGPSFHMTDTKSILGVMLSDEKFEQLNSRHLQLLHLHHQGVRPDDVNQSELKVTAVTDDDQYVEAVEHKYHPFCLGVQFHPEYNEEFGLKMIREVVDYARQLKAPSFDNRATVQSYLDLHEAELAVYQNTSDPANVWEQGEWHAS